MNQSAVLAGLAAFLLGTAVVVSKQGFRYVPPAIGASVSIPSTAIMMWCLAPFLLETTGLDVAAGIIFAIVGLVFPAVVTWLTFTATDRVGPTVTNSVSSTAPLFAIACAIAFLGEPLTANMAIGVTLITLGVVALSWQDRRGRRQWHLWLVALPLFASAVRGGALTLTKYGLNLWPDPFVACLIGYTVSAGVITGFSPWASRVSDRYDPRRALPWFAAVGLLNGTAMLTMYQALRWGSVGIVSPIVATSPLFTLLLSGLLLKQERVDALVVSGVLAVLGGVVVLLQ